MIVVPIALALIFLLLFATFGSVRLGLLIFLSVPLGAVGGVLALWLRGMSFSISAGVGFIALSGVAVLDGLVLVAAHPQLIEEGRRCSSGARGVDVPAAADPDDGPGRQPRVRADGLLARRPGPRSSGPLATVVIGGLVTSMFLKLVVLPGDLPLVRPGPSFPPGRRPRRARGSGRNRAIGPGVRQPGAAPVHGRYGRKMRANGRVSVGLEGPRLAHVLAGRATE